MKIFKVVILCPYIKDECNGDVLSGSGVLKISEKIGVDLKIDYNHEENELKNIKLIETEILNMSQEWGDKTAKKGSLIGTIKSTNDQVNECIQSGIIRGVSIHTRFNPDESPVCACEVEENPADKTFNNTENKECLIPKFLSLIGGKKIPCNGFEIMTEENNENNKKDSKPDDVDTTKSELTEERIGEIFAEAIKPLVEAIGELKVTKAEANDDSDSEKTDEKNKTTETGTETPKVTEDSKDKVEIKKAKPDIKTDIYGLEIVKIGE